LKAANVLVNNKFQAKITDFGFSIKRKEGASGTPFWMAPELLDGFGSNSAASDVYSFGIMLYEVYSRQHPYQGEDYSDVIRDICDPSINKRPPVPESMPSEVANLLYSICLAANPASRPTFVELDGFLKRLQPDNVDPGEQVGLKIMQQNMEAQSYQKLMEEVFPPHVAAALSKGQKVEPEDFECVTIFFSDIVGFTTLSSVMDPKKVSDMVHRLYDKMDALSSKYGVQKLETIGDAWVGAANLYTPCPHDHVKRVAQFSMEGKRDTIYDRLHTSECNISYLHLAFPASRAASATLVDEDDPSLGCIEIRIGFHSGPCTAGVVGARLPKYTVFGDTINTASRMESNGKPGRIHCSDRSEELLRTQAPEIPTKCRGQIHVKGKGDMTTYWVGE
jgi:class 3 adenylate cyclase